MTPFDIPQEFGLNSELAQRDVEAIVHTGYHDLRGDGYPDPYKIRSSAQRPSTDWLGLPLELGGFTQPNRHSVGFKRIFGTCCLTALRFWKT